MKKELFIPVLVGVAVLGYLWLRKKRSQDVTLSKDMEERVVANETKRVTNQFTPAFKMQYEVVLPPVQASKAVKQAAYAMQDDRKRIEMERMASKTPVYA